jgi:hypothetical protein
MVEGHPGESGLRSRGQGRSHSAVLNGPPAAVHRDANRAEEMGVLTPRASVVPEVTG